MILTRFFLRLSAVFIGFAVIGIQAQTLRPPSVPLVACDPYFSIWSPADKLTDADTTHWTGKSHRLTSTVQIDGKIFRVMGKTPDNAPAFPQTQLDVLPTRTIYVFEGAGVKLTLTFMTPALPQSIDLLSRPVTYLTYDFVATDGKTHDVSLQFTANGEIVVNEGKQEVMGATEKIGSLTAARLGSKAQNILRRKGDDVRIDWGYFYAAAESSVATSEVNVGTELAVPGSSAKATLTFSNFKVDRAPVSRWLMVAYDDLYSIQYMKKNLRPYWRRHGWEAADLLQVSADEYASLQKRCADFDEELMADLTRARGEKYAKICALAFRQCFAAGKFVADANGQPLQFNKENHSNGCIGTADLFYPMAPQFLLFGSSLAKSFVVPFMDYASGPRWKFPFAPHDLGVYPAANGQVYGDGERGENNQMPVEESGNLLILFAAIAEMEGNASFANHYWPKLETWAEYLKQKGFDPENQLCTDDFAGHMAHNVNLSAKAICALASFSRLCEMRGDKIKAAEYAQTAKEFAQRWTNEAASADHYRLAFDKPESWSQKYNATWDRILGLNLWSPEIWKKEMAFYKTKMNAYGLPLDSRRNYTKLDWTLWTATLTQNPDDFDALVEPVFKFINKTSDRSPMTDWYETKDARKVMFTARSVVGGVFLQMLYDKTTWAKWAKRDETRAENWAPMPVLPTVTTVVPAADTAPAKWRYTTSKPKGDWFKPGFNDSSWSLGKSAFGTEHKSMLGTKWTTNDIWLRREVTLSADDLKDLQGWLNHDEDVEVYINGVLAISVDGYVSSYDDIPLSDAARAALKPGKNIIAIHCHQTVGGQYIDFGFVKIKK